MVYVFLAEGFEEIEALTPVDILRRAGVETSTVAVGTAGREVTGSHGITVSADLQTDGVNTEGLEAVVLPGGMPGTRNLEQDETVQKLIDFCVEREKWIGAICAAPSILGHKGLLEGRRATAYPTFMQELGGASLSDDYVCRDGHIITARGMGVSVPFALKLAEVLVSPEKAEEIEAGIQWEG